MPLSSETSQETLLKNAAPDLFEAAKAVLLDLERNYGHLDSIQSLIAAVAKAEGRIP
jgi:hypothetical protein